MYKSLIALAVLSAISGPAVAQAAPDAQAPAATPAKPQMVKKVVCRRVVDEEVTGSHLPATHKECKTIDVPAADSASSDRAPVRSGAEPGSQ